MTRKLSKTATYVSVAFVILLTDTLLSHTALADVIVADYIDDFHPSSPATGWRYMWNEFGAIGTAASYDDLASHNPTGLMYTATGGDRFGDPSYDALFLGEASSGPGTGHPGPGVSEGAPFDRFVIAGYTLQSGDPSAIYSLLSTSIRRESSSGGDLELRVYANDTLKYSAIVSPPSIVGFDTSLGFLSPGDSVYVAVGPNGNHASDSFKDWDFSISAVPEPSTFALTALGLMGVGYRRRKRA